MNRIGASHGPDSYMFQMVMDDENRVAPWSERTATYRCRYAPGQVVFVRDEVGALSDGQHPACRTILRVAFDNSGMSLELDVPNENCWFLPSDVMSRTEAFESVASRKRVRDATT